MQNPGLRHFGILGLLVAATAAFPASAVAQSAGVSERGAPVQGVYHSRTEIEVPGGNPKTDRYKLDLDKVGIFSLFSMARGANGNYYPHQMASAAHLISGKRLDVEATYRLSGKWVALGEAENTLESRQDQPFGVAVASQMSKEESTEFGQSVGMEIGISGEPFGVGVSESISASLTWNKTTTRGTSDGVEINTGGTMRYGTGMQAWQFVGIAVIQLDCRTVFRTEAEFREAMERACGRATDPSGPYNWEGFKSQGILTFRGEFPTKKITLTEYPIPGHEVGGQPSQPDNAAALEAMRAQLAEADTARAEAERQRLAAEVTAAAQAESVRQLVAAAQAEAARQTALAAAAKTEAEAAAAREAAAAANQVAAATAAQQAAAQRAAAQQAAAKRAQAARQAAAKRAKTARQAAANKNKGKAGPNNNKGKGKGKGKAK